MSGLSDDEGERPKVGLILPAWLDACAGAIDILQRAGLIVVRGQRVGNLADLGTILSDARVCPHIRETIVRWLATILTRRSLNAS
ncbi:MAG: hypothetical protein QHC40_00420 [Sphingobium sp.]|nr:hypothetical protein [Sphingobium sp.]